MVTLLESWEATYDTGYLEEIFTIADPDGSGSIEYAAIEFLITGLTGIDCEEAERVENALADKD